MRRTLITGGLGFVGSHFAKRLAAKPGDDVRVVDVDYPVQPCTRYDPLIRYSICDIREWMRTGPPDGYDLIIHCAAVVGGRQNIEGDPLAVATDLSIDAEFFNWLAKHKFKGKVIYFSSSAVYPIELQRKAKTCYRLAEWDTSLSDESVGIPDMTYGWAKLTGEYLAQFAAKQYDIDVVIYRPFSGYGEDQDLCYPFPALVKKVVSVESPIVIWGSGDQCRDFIHIDDIVDAVLETMDILQPGEALNLGTGVATSFKQLVEALHVKCKHALRPRKIFDVTKPEGVFYRVADVTKLHKLYVPKISLNEGIKRMVDHARNSTTA